MAPRISVSLCQKVKNEVRMTPLKPHESAHNILLFMKESSLNTPLFLTDRIKGINVTDNLWDWEPKCAFQTQSCASNWPYLGSVHFLLPDHIPDTITHSHTYVIFTPYTLKNSLKPLLFSHNTSYFLETAQFATEQQSLQVRRDSDSLSSAAVKDGQHKHAFVNSPTCASDLFRCFFALNEPLSELLRICHNERKSQWVIYSFSLNCAEVFA